MKEAKQINSRKRQKIIFYCLLLAFPLVQNAIFYLFVNFNSILLSFKTYTATGYEFVGFSNYQKVFSEIVGGGVFSYAIKNSALLFGVEMVIILPLTLFFSFYIAKKYALSTFFRIILFLPTIVSSIVMVLIYTYLLEYAIPEIVTKLGGGHVESFLFGKTDRAFTSVMIYYVWVSFGANVILYSGTMSGISQDVIEAANLDGATGIKEFWYISVPGVWSTFVVLTLAKLTGFFTNKFNLFSFYGTSADAKLYTIGYYLFRETQSDLASMTVFPRLSAMGVIFTIIIAPITICVKRLLEKIGPKED